MRTFRAVLPLLLAEPEPGRRLDPPEGPSAHFRRASGGGGGARINPSPPPPHVPVTRGCMRALHPLLSGHVPCLCGILFVGSGPQP